MASQPIYQFYTELEDYEPKIWRRFQVLQNITMARLGYVLMTMYEMKAEHLFCFDVPHAENYFRYQAARIGKENVIDIFQQYPEEANWEISISDEFDEDIPFEGKRMDAAATRMKDVLRHEQDRMTFSYDFGDGWEISVVLEKILRNSDIPGDELPRVLEGAGYGIIEDCGGSGGL